MFKKAIIFLSLSFVFGVVVLGAYIVGQASIYREQVQTSTPEVQPSADKTTQQVDSDPVVTCTSSYPNCSGQSIQAKQSACSNIYCCQVGDKWSVYASENACKAAQDAAAPPVQQSNNATTKYPPCTINFSQLGAITYNTISPEDCVSKQIEAKVNDAATQSRIKCIQNYGEENCPAP